MASSSNANIRTPVSFPFPPPEPSNGSNNKANASPTNTQKRSRTSTNASTTSTTSRLRTASIKLMEASPPPGMWAATGSVASRAPTFTEIRDRSFGVEGWHEETQRQKRVNSGEAGALGTSGAPESPVRPPARSSPGASRGMGTEPFPTVTEEDMNAMPSNGTAADMGPSQLDGQAKERDSAPESRLSSEITDVHKDTARPPHHNERQYSNGYIPPPKVPWTRTTAIALRAFSKWVLTPSGFLITLYALNVVAWGGMLFLLLCNAAPAMCNPTCDDIESPRRIWVEIDSQILNSLFCVTGFGLAPWRFRDLYWWTLWRLGRSPQRKEKGIRRLAGIHNNWYRLPGSDNLPPYASPKTVDPEDPAVPIPETKMPAPPPTGIHAPPTKSWKMDFVLWMNAGNTFFQIILCYYMWHYNRYDRPSWATGLFVACGCIVAGVGGIMIYHEGKLVKRVEGVPAPKGYRYEDGHVEDVEKDAASAPLSKSNANAGLPDGTAQKT